MHDRCPGIEFQPELSLRFEVEFAMLRKNDHGPIGEDNIFVDAKPFCRRGWVHLGILLTLMLVAGEARAQFIPDDFNVCDLDPMWTVVDPLGDGGTATIVNGYTDDAAVAISVPGGNP